METKTSVVCALWSDQFLVRLKFRLKPHPSRLPAVMDGSIQIDHPHSNGWMPPRQKNQLVIDPSMTPSEKPGNPDRVRSRRSHPNQTKGVDVFFFIVSDTHFLLYIYDNLRNALIDRSQSRSQSRSLRSSPPLAGASSSNLKSSTAHYRIHILIFILLHLPHRKCP